jgi:S1-C subfamily serine protease
VKHALAALAVLALVGCSGDEDAASTAAATTGATSTKAIGFEAIPDIVAGVEPSVVTVLVEGRQGEGSGSGVIWDDEGRIVTNNHVVAGATRVEIVLTSGVQLAAKVLGTDERTDLAVVQVEREGLPAATFADQLPRVGELAIAIGSPLGLTNTATAGIVSALHRDLPSGGTTPALVDLLQTDAAISPGNSGGALAAIDGSVIGINVAYLPPQESGAVSIGFAIPAPTVSDIVPQLIEDGKAEHAYLGVEPAPVTEELSQELKLGVDEGVLVVSVSPGSPAARAGVRRNEVIVSLESEPIKTVEDLYAALRQYKPGDTVSVTVVRAGERRDVSVTLGALPAR